MGGHCFALHLDHFIVFLSPPPPASMGPAWGDERRSPCL